ncbi:MAG TPA: M3 family metallopeptidase [Povalibacter sp.]|uniref:M3 family metallopeptidase n=1 Tax=Povalibacter sp. TaxID=1962978 RepID=UPI002B78C013|nr:M3 family metallopeptidase [Povalibacter sp.]HMN45192.1 M3 family metallopeptidase [Povalibacter sp.]
MTNPLLQSHDLPPFSAIRPEHIEPAIRQVLDENRAKLQSLLASGAKTWDSLVVPLEEMQHRLSRTWSPVGHMNGVVNSDELRAAYNACLPLLTAWHTDLAQNIDLYAAYEHILKNESGRLTAAQRKLLENALRDFRLAGVALPEEKKQQFKTLMEKLTTLQSKFDENVLDATNAWSRHVTNEAELNGLPAPVVQRARAAAEAAGKEGWLFSLDAPNYTAVLMHAEDENLRREFYHGWVTRGSDQGLSPERWDNSALMGEILATRRELANLVGFDNYVEYSLATKMASSTKEVREFLEQLATKSKPVAQREFADLVKFAGRALSAWDVGFYAERQKQQKFSLSEEALRPYFPLPRVLQGMFAVAERLYGVNIVERATGSGPHPNPPPLRGGGDQKPSPPPLAGEGREGVVDVYHPDARFYDILNRDGSRRGSFFVDLYARPKKRGGAWMDECVGRKHLGAGSTTLPVAYLVCNFTPPVGKQPSLLTHSEVVTMFHEFGHGLHHMLTRVDYPSIAGINGVAWDAVELPSQFMENFAWRPEVLPLISSHVDTGEPLPQEELQRLLGSRTYQAGMASVRQLEFALFDLRIHSEIAGEGIERVLQILGEVRDSVAVIKPPAFNRFAHGFQHIFSGGYAAGYYSYKWAEVLAADAFSAFEEQGIFNEQVSRRFLSAILEQGGSRDAMEAFVDFRGRKPQIEPLLKQLGLAA